MSLFPLVEDADLNLDERISLEPISNQVDESKLCYICKTEPFKYKCPGCLKHTCSLNCSKQHKIKYNCNGRKVINQFIEKFSYTETNFKEDYSYLNEMKRVSDNLEREKKTKDIKIETIVKPNHKKQAFQRVCKKKYQVETIFLPESFKKAKLNRSFIDAKSQQICWSLELQTDLGCGIKSEVVHKIPGDTVLKDLLLKKRFLDKEVKVDEIFLVMLKYGSKANQQEYYLLDLNLDLNENLKDKVVLEFPTLEVVNQIEQLHIINQ